MALVAGFFIRYSTIPLFISIGFSASATVLITIGWARRRRLEDEVEFPEPDVEEIVAEVDEFGADGDEFIATTELPAARAAATPTIELGRSHRKRPAGPEGSRSPTKQAGKVVVIPGRGRYHTSRCRFAKNPAAEKISSTAALSRGLAPCSVCKPG